MPSVSFFGRCTTQRSPLILLEEPLLSSLGLMFTSTMTLSPLRLKSNPLILWSIVFGWRYRCRALAALISPSNPLTTE